MRSLSTSRSRQLLKLGGVPFRVTQRLYRKGVWDTLQRVRFLTHTWYRERRLGIKTTGFIPWHELSQNSDSVDYEAVGYRTLDRAFRLLGPLAEDEVLVDFGSGMGRVLCEAARRPFRRIIGVELSGALCAVARRNLAAARSRLVCSDVEVIESAADDWPFPDAATMVFLFNPFNGKTLEAVIDNLEASLQRRPRPLAVAYVLPYHEADLFADRPTFRRAADTDSEGLRLRIYSAQLE